MRWHRWITGWGGMLITLLVVVSCASTPTRRSTGEMIDDVAITTKVKASLIADPMVSALAVSVETTKGVVTLTGIVSSDHERQRAIEVADAVAGVMRVDARNLFVKR
ncbi:MAG: BON domain-containing protein [Nitrospinae bacterium]|nr:BON domain-containing protein [Nitrospinota bacterium]